jgi:hypothetical protein
MMQTFQSRRMRRFLSARFTLIGETLNTNPWRGMTENSAHSLFVNVMSFIHFDATTSEAKKIPYMDV